MRNSAAILNNTIKTVASVGAMVVIGVCECFERSGFWLGFSISKTTHVTTNTKMFDITVAAYLEGSSNPISVNISTKLFIFKKVIHHITCYL